MIDKATVEKIKDTADIVEVVSDYVHLIRRGANYMGLCPFHNERTPSFSVNRSKNFCYCFSCKKGGSPVNFIMEKEGLSYHDALLHLARKYNIEVEERELTDEERQYQNEREAMMVANEWAANEMSRVLSDTEDGKNIGLSYLYQRGVTAEAIAKFRLGYSLDRGTALLEAARKAGYDDEILYKLGLEGRNRDNRLYDRFRGRVMFPIINASGKVVGFGGRDLKGGPAKYINSPESAVYKKSNELYGIYQAKSEIVRQDKCFLVEGYLDVIGMWQAGLQNVVASSGTALTDGQIALIHRFTNKITLLYDGDAAGIKASLRGIDMLLKHRMEVKVLLLPDGHDPDSFAKAHTPEQFRKYIEEHETDIIRFQTKVLMDEAGNDPQRRIAAANSVVQSIASIPDAISRAVYIPECARIFQIDESSIVKAVELARRSIEKNYRHEREMEYKRLQDKTAQDREQPAPEDSPAAGSSTPEGQDKEAAKESADTSLLKRRQSEDERIESLEKALIESCIRYALLPFNASVEECSPEEEINVAEAVAEELEADDVTFRNPTYRRILEILIDCRAPMEKGKAYYMEKQEKELEEYRRSEHEKLAESVISMQGLALAEKNLEKEIQDRRNKALREYLSDYPAKMLASHEEDEVRRTCTRLITETRSLSKIYTKGLRTEDIDKQVEDEKRLRITRGIMELKNEIFLQKYNRTMEEFRQSEQAGISDERRRELMLQLTSLMRIRSRLAQNLGERTICPRR